MEGDAEINICYATVCKKCERGHGWDNKLKEE
jgi:hypothetical protein